MVKQIATIWDFRHFWMSLVVMDLRTRYRRSILGVGWSLMNPLLMTVVFCVVFGAWFNNPDWRQFGPYFLAGITLFDFVRTSALSGCQTFFRNESYIRQCPLPLSIYVLRTVLGAAIHFLIALAVVIVAVFVLLPEQRIPLFANSWILVPGLLMLFMFCLSISVLAGFMTVYFQDTQQLLEVIFQIFFFLTPIMYPSKMILDRGLGILLSINPVVTFLELVRMPIITGQVPTMWAFAKAAIVVGMFGSLAIAALAKFEKKLIFHL
ncbi:MAG: ABC transporter permease [Planctomycetes bacterium]|nr:ABC transporter permease [Planctomycetota bacterium]